MITRPTCIVARSVCATAILLSGCFTSGPPDNLGFSEIAQLSDLDGIYENLGEGGSFELRLSQLVWPDAEDLDHARINRIEVKAIETHTLVVSAMDNSAAVIQQEEFVEDEDFKINEGVIQLSSRIVAPPLDSESMTHFLGIGYEDVDIGLDEAGHGKYRSTGVMGGLLFIWFPIAAGGSNDVRFPRVTD